MGTSNTANADPLTVLEEALRGGVTCFQLREKGPNALIGNEKYMFAQQCKSLCTKFGVPFIVNDDIDLAIALDADGVHIGQDDANVRDVRNRIGAHKIVGLSTHTTAEVEEAIAAGADYVGIGPIFSTQSKSDAKPVAGTGFLEQTRDQFPELQIVGIGGITIDNFVSVIDAGANGIATISSIANAKSPYQTAQQFNDLLQRQLQKER